MTWTFDNDRPLYLQVMEHLKLGILSGELPSGSRLPAVRDLAGEASINPNTMQKALSELEREGLLYTQRTNGRFVTEDKALLEDLHYQMVRGKLLEFAHQMERLGYTLAQLSQMITKVLEEEQKDG